MRRLLLVLAAAAVVFGLVFAVPAITPDGSKTGLPAWRSIDGVPVVDALPDGFAGAVRIARERKSENAGTTVVLAPEQSCPAAALAVGTTPPLRAPASGSGDAVGCRTLRVMTVIARPGVVTVRAGATTWTFNPTKRDPRSCQLSRDRTCMYWLLEGGRFADQLPDGGDRVASGDPRAALALGTFPLLNLGTADRDTGEVKSTDVGRVLLCAAAAGPSCGTDVSFSVRGNVASDGGPGATTPGG